MSPLLALLVAQEIPETLDSPLPLAARIFQFLFQVPQWIQIGGVLVGLVAGLVVGRWLWARRAAFASWAQSLTTPWRAGVIVTGILGVALFFLGGMATWDYTQHSNAFCSGCHVMESAYGRFQDSEHGVLECHDCHQQPVSASARQLVLWVLERPEEIGAHAPVDNEICVTCHVTEDPDSTWHQIAGTAGHRAHLESDSTALTEATCVTCHGLEVHRFVPGLQTCGQSGCHQEDATQIVLGGMATTETTLHCVACHSFNAPVGEEAPTLDVFAALSPASEQCSTCHVTEGVQETFDVEGDPHEGRCGLCHNPHEQTLPELAQETCATADCHQDFFDQTPFHGLESVHASDCASCHEAHTWTAPTDCRACHTDLS
ncbi:MAG: NapC/NirT family cytochrome c [Longimicrobiales bacterium]